MQSIEWNTMRAMHALISFASSTGHGPQLTGALPVCTWVYAHTKKITQLRQAGVTTHPLTPVVELALRLLPLSPQVVPGGVRGEQTRAVDTPARVPT